VTSSECGRRLVGDENLRLARECHGDHDSLSHAPAQLMGIVVEAFRGVGDAHHIQQFDRSNPGLLARNRLVSPKRFGDL
jgi:hypothetical protein